jgi:hypothetical protein
MFCAGEYVAVVTEKPTLQRIDLVASGHSRGTYYTVNAPAYDENAAKKGEKQPFWVGTVVEIKGREYRSPNVDIAVCSSVVAG